MKNFNIATEDLDSDIISIILLNFIRLFDNNSQKQ